jgi:predicted NAD-dependent protein-ADP-ribosyltransferase YbiA (DUF1768 family)
MNSKDILNKSIINFFYKKDDYNSLSNFYINDIVIVDKNDTREYESGEHCFHGEKYIRLSNLCSNKNRKDELLEYGKKFIKPCIYKNGIDVKKIGGKKGLILNKDELDLWNNISVDVQKEICKYKFINYPKVRNDLIKSQGKILVHPALRCNEEKVKNKIFEGKGIIKDGSIVILGGNKLGNIWMELRDY